MRRSTILPLVLNELKVDLAEFVFFDGGTPDKNRVGHRVGNIPLSSLAQKQPGDLAAILRAWSRLLTWIKTPAGHRGHNEACLVGSSDAFSSPQALLRAGLSPATLFVLMQMAVALGLLVLIGGRVGVLA